MARKRDYSSLYWRQLKGDSWFHFYQRSLTNLVVQMFEWKGLPETVNPIFLEKTLHNDGMIAFYKDPRFQEMCVKGAPTFLNPYGDPTEFQAAMYMYNKQFPLYTYLTPIEKAKTQNVGVICRNQIDGFTSSQEAIFLFAALLAENKQTKLVSQNALKIPYVFKGTPEQVLTFKNFFERVQANEPMLVVDEDEDILKKFEILNTNAPFYLDKLNADNVENYNEFLTHFGINNVNIQKKERVNVSEANSNNELILHNRNKFLAPRKECARILSELWETTITVDLREDLIHKEDEIQPEKKQLEVTEDGTV